MQEKQVEREFLESFSVEPKRRRYYFVIACGHSGAFRSMVYELGDMTHYKDPVDLGRIKLTPAGPGGKN